VLELVEEVHDWREIGFAFRVSTSSGEGFRVLCARQSCFIEGVLLLDDDDGVVGVAMMVMARAF